MVLVVIEAANLGSAFIVLGGCIGSERNPNRREIEIGDFLGSWSLRGEVVDRVPEGSSGSCEPTRRRQLKLADVAQLVEHSLGKGEVIGSIPIISSRV